VARLVVLLGVALAVAGSLSLLTAKSESVYADFEAHVTDEVLIVEGVGSLAPEIEQLVTTPREVGQTQIEELIEEGTPVKKGQVLVRLSTFLMENAGRKAQVQLRNKEAELHRMARESALSSAEETAKVENQQAELTCNQDILAYQEGGPDPRIVQTLGLKISKARLDEEYLQRKLLAQQALNKRGYLSDLEYDSIRTDQVKARLDRSQQENSLVLQKQGPRAEERKRSRTLVRKDSLNLSLSKKVARSQSLIRNLANAKKQAEISDRQVVVDEAAWKRSKAILKAPMDGVVVYSAPKVMEPLQVGSVTFGGRELLKVVRNGIMRARVQVNERFIDRVKVGQSASVLLYGHARPYPAKVELISRLATQRDPKDSQSPRDFCVLLALDRVYPVLRPNMSCRARIEVARLAQVARVPADAVFERKKTSVQLAVLTDGAVVRRTVSLIDEDFDFVFVRGVKTRERLLILDK